MGVPPDPAATVRIDRWLLAARVFKTRPLCQEACEGGKVAVNGTRASSHKSVRAGDRVRIQTERGLRDLEVLQLGEKRLPAADAVLLYADHSPPPEPRPDVAALGLPVSDRGAGRPSKRDRRAISRLRGR
ncbi:MAG: RNA-binding S4 domain-containing protein [Alphaproteobacteria bacterium]